MKPGWTDDSNAVVRAITPFDVGAKGAGLREVALEVLQRHGANAHIDDVMSWCCQAMLPIASRLEGALEETIPFYGALYQWALYGCPHFSLTPDFFNAIALTDFGDPSDDPLYMPFHAFTMSFPPSDFLDGASKLMVYRLPKSFTDAQARIHTLEWKLYRATLLKDTPIFTQWTIGMTRRELNDEAADMDANVPGKGIRPLDEEELALPMRIRTLLANVMSYVESNGPLPTEARARRGAAAAPVERVHSERPVYDIGRTVKLDGGLRKALLESAGNKERWHVTQRFAVRGHWRNQVYGQGRLLRRRQWIAPFKKGPENAVDALTRNYEVKE